MAANDLIGQLKLVDGLIEILKEKRRGIEGNIETSKESARTAAIQEIEAVIKKYEELSISAADLSLSKESRKIGVKKRIPMYRDPTSGMTWSGHGNPPKWLVGKEKEQYLIEAES